MGTKGTPQPPTPPSPERVSRAQFGENVGSAIANAALNNADIFTPFGSRTYDITGYTTVNNQRVPTYRINERLSAPQQRLLDVQTANQQRIANVAGAGLDRVKNTMNRGFDPASGAPARQGPVAGQSIQNVGNNQGPVRESTARPALTSGYQGQTLDTSQATAPALQVGFAASPAVQTDISAAGLRGIAGNTDFGAERSRVEQALYDRQTQFLDERMSRDRATMEANLANQGIAVGSDAYINAMAEFDRRGNEAYAAARNDAIMQAGSEQGRLFDQSLRARGQQFGERATQGDFRNRAADQAFGQNLTRAQFGNEAAQAGFENRLASQQAANMARAQQEALSQGRAAFGNQAALQGQSADLARVDQANRAQSQRFDQNMAAAGFNNQAAGQRFQQDMQNAALGNSVRDQMIQENMLRRNIPFQDIAYLMGTASPVQMPQFAPTPTYGVQAPNYAGLVQQNYQNQLANQQFQVGQRNAGIGNVFGSLASLGGAAILASDANAKWNIRRIGARSGVTIYQYRYKGKPGVYIGVIAQDIEARYPGAVMTVNGLKLVDYAKLWELADAA